MDCAASDQDENTGHEADDQALEERQDDEDDQAAAGHAGMERRGIATELMKAAEAWAARRGLPFLTLDTGAANQPARSLYHALGYREEDVRLTKAISSPGP